MPKSRKPSSVPSFADEFDAIVSSEQSQSLPRSSLPPHVIIEARAGTGKTTTLVEGLKAMRGSKTKITPSDQQRQIWDTMALSSSARSICFTAFNKSIADELKSRLPPGCDASTIHGLGFRAVRRAFQLGDPPVNGDRVKFIMEEITGSKFYDLQKQEPVAIQTTKRLVDLCRLNLAEPTDDMLMELVEYYELECDPRDEKRILELTPAILHRLLDVNKDGCIDFCDMIWLPVKLDLPVWRNDLLLVDELQDLNRCQQALVLKAGTRIIGCGDPKQCQPAGTMVRVTGKYYPIPIEQLKVGDQLVTFNPNGSTFNGKQTQGRRVEKIASRQYDGDMYLINGARSTPNHRWLTRFRPDVPSDWTALYLVELPDSTYRVGITQLVMGEGRGAFGPGMRARQRGANKLWVLHVFKSRLEAREAEFKFSMTFRVPQLANYENNEDSWCLDLINEGVTSDVETALASYGRLYEYPIWTKGESQHVGKYSYVTQACNLIPEVNQICRWIAGQPVWELVDVCIESDWSGVVYSLQVQPTEGGKRLYISDDLVTHNSIYGFAGAVSSGMSVFEDRLQEDARGCDHLMLTVTRRCGKEIVSEAQRYVPDFTAHENNPDGTVERMVLKEGKGLGKSMCYRPEVQNGDMIVCRVNSFLVSECLKFIREGRKATIRGRDDVGQGLINLVKKMMKKTKLAPEDEAADLIEPLEDWAADQRRKENAKKSPSESRLANVSDKLACVLAFVEDAEECQDVIRKIESIFTDNDNVEGIKLSSIHKAKGLEADTVFYIRVPGGKRNMQEWQAEQERNLCYVAITRAISRLVYVAVPSKHNPEGEGE